MGEALVASVMAVVTLLFLAALTALALQRLRFPYTVGLVILGAGLAYLRDDLPEIGAAIETFELQPELILFVFIPVLIFESAFNIDARLLARNLVPALVLAAPGLLLSTAIVGGVTAWLTAIPLGSALVLGCIVSATDPVAVIALFKEVGAPRRLNVLVEGESLFNDATAIVLYNLLVGIVAVGIVDGPTITGGILRFFVVFVGGLIVGLGFGYLLASSIRAIGDEPLVQIAMTLVVAYGSFIVAEHFLHTSGIMALLGAGLTIGYFGKDLYPHRVQEHLEISWENFAFIANSFIFLLLGLSEKTFLSNVLGNPQGLLWPAIVVIGVAMAARALVVFGLVSALNLGRAVRPISRAYQVVMYWGGLRGAVAVALALSLPPTFPFRWQIIDITFAVTLFTLLVNGTTMRWVLGGLGLDRPTPVLGLLAAHCEVEAKRAAVARLDEPELVDAAGPAAASRVRREAAADLAVAEREYAAALRDLGDDEQVHRQLLWLRAIATQRSTFHQRFSLDLLSLGGLRELQWDLRDAENSVLTHQRVPDELTLPHRFEARHWSRRIRESRILPTQLQLGSVHSLYRQLSALAASARVVLDRLDDLAATSEAGPDDVAAVRSHFERSRQLAAEQLRLLEERIDRIGYDLQERQLRHHLDSRAEEARHVHGIPVDHLPQLLVDSIEQGRR